MADSIFMDAAANAVLKLRVDNGVGQAQVSLAEQMRDCVNLVAAAGYYDLADHLGRVAREAGV